MRKENVKTFQKAVKWCAIAFAIFLSVSIIVGIIGALGSVFGIFGGTTLDEMKAYEISGEVRDIELEINAAEFEVSLGEAFSVRSNLKKLSVTLDNGVLKIKEEKNSLWQNYNGALLEIVIPRDFSFGSAEIITGAGVVNIESLSTDRLDLTLGAGKVVIGSLTAASSAEIEGGAGELNILGGALAYLDFDMGVGECNLTSKMTGECELNLGIGEANITLLGSADEYRLSFSTGIGRAKFNGDSVEDGQVIGNGACRIDIEGGIGAVNVNTKN